ncbi:MAG TPA: DMT family transporter [Jatrophihabitantaceae bacterium]|nr:DMT family transporter [Jatrophihabitantaceae bacterium]
MSRRSWLLFAAMCVIWGVPYLMIRVAVREVSPGALVFARTTLGALLLLPIAIKRDALRPVLRKWRPLLAYTAVEVAVPWLLLSDAETKLSSSLTGLLVAAVPLVGVAIARLQGTDDPVDAVRGFGLLLGIGGVVALLGLDLGEVHVGPLVEVAVVVVCYAVGPAIISRHLSDVPVMGVVVLSLAITAVGYLPVAVLDPPQHLPANVIWSVIGLATICTALAFILFFALIAAIGPARATVITYVNPAVAVLLGVLLLDEHFTVGMAVGFPLILLGSVLAARKRTARGSAQVTPVAEPAPS